MAKNRKPINETWSSPHFSAHPGAVAKRAAVKRKRLRGKVPLNEDYFADCGEAGYTYRLNEIDGVGDFASTTVGESVKFRAED